jgi:hypothetical protein
MPNYSKSIIYKLECKDPDVTEIYVGVTTNFYDRKRNHKSKCINKEEWNTPVYCFMRLHGGWDNWNMLQIEEVNARNKRHLNQIEAKYIRELKAELNSEIPQDIESGLDRKEWKKEYNKVYCAKNVEKNSERLKEYYAKNKEKIAGKNKVKVVCECGSEVRKDNLEKHKRTQKHQKWINIPEPNLVFVD